MAVRVGVSVASGVFVPVAEGTGVSVGAGVHVDVEVGTSVGGKIWFATGCPNTADATENDPSTNATVNHCQPANMRARRVR